jgi:multidrug resistance efflux pump
MVELDELREELVGARAEVERLAEQLADREAQALTQSDELAALRRDLEATRAAALDEARQAAARYRAVLLQAAPDVPPDLIQGESVDDLDRALATAREVVARVREQVQLQTAARVPAGSPVRGAPNLDALSPAELIRAGISERRV